jgi:alpha-N-arabinofuranosidase
LGDMVRYLSIHRYWENATDYYSFMGQSAIDFEEKIKVIANEIETERVMNNFKNPIYLSVDEWGSFGNNFRSVLPIAQSLNSFIRQAAIVKMANFTLMTSLLSSDPKKGSFKSPLFYTFKLFSNNCLGNAIDSYVACDTFDTQKYKGIPYLDVSTVYSKESHTVYINVVNRHQDKAITTDILSTTGELAGKAQASEVNSASLTAPFTFDKKDQYVPVTREVPVSNNKITYSFPAHSFTQIKIGVKEK